MSLLPLFYFIFHLTYYFFIDIYHFITILSRIFVLNLLPCFFILLNSLFLFYSSHFFSQLVLFFLFNFLSRQAELELQQREQDFEAQITRIKILKEKLFKETQGEEISMLNLICCLFLFFWVIRLQSFVFECLYHRVS